MVFITGRRFLVAFFPLTFKQQNITLQQHPNANRSESPMQTLYNKAKSSGTSQRLMVIGLRSDVDVDSGTKERL
jgi:hypothetical protein